MIVNIFLFVTCVVMSSHYKDFALPLSTQYLAELDKIIFIPFIFLICTNVVLTATSQNESNDDRTWIQIIIDFWICNHYADVVSKNSPLFLYFMGIIHTT
eukprot:UN14067